MTIRHTAPDAESLAADVVQRRIQADIAALSSRGHAQRQALLAMLRDEVADLEAAVDLHSASRQPAAQPAHFGGAI